MTPNFIIRVCRGSIFTSTVKYDIETWQKLSTKFIGYLPYSQIPAAVAIQMNTLQIPGPNYWVMSSKADNIDVYFLEGKIDVILKDSNKQYSKDSISELCNKFQIIFAKLIDSLDLVVSRIAFAPLLVNNRDDTSQYVDFAKSIFRDRKFRGSSVDNCDFSNVFRVKENIEGEEIIINCLANFAVAQLPEVINMKLVVRNELQVNLDINTLGGQHYIFTIDKIKSFYNKVVDLTIDFVDSYL